MSVAGIAPALWLQNAAPPILNPYRDSSRLPWWKGQLHMHTARSYDGEPQMTPAQRATSYQSIGYRFAV
jgi:hypothetical protein